MIPVKDRLVDVDNLPGEEIEFGIGDPRWVMKTQADLYSDITTAIIREYSTNAYDAHVMAGNPDPIQVTLPSTLNPYFVVEDKGVGMDMDIFRRVYTQFGISDKRDSNKTNGMLGYGSKSGVAYTTQFRVTTVKDGYKIEGIVKRKPDWRIVLKVVSQEKTSEPNGTRIEIPVHNIDEFKQKARDFYKFWLPGRVLVNGQEPEHYVGDKITDGLYYSQGWNTSYIVMGNVPYRINNPSALFYNSKMKAINFVAYADTIGDGENAEAAVEFTPSREDLKYTDHTKNTLQKIINDFESEIVAKAKAEIDGATSHAEAFSAWHKWTNVLGKSMFDDLTYKGEKLQSDFKIVAKRYSLSAYTYAVQSIAQWHVEAMPKTMIVTNFDLVLSSRHKKMVREYANMKGWSLSYVLFTTWSDSEIVSKWIKRDQIVDWKTVVDTVPKPPKKPRVPSGPSGRTAGSFDYITAAGRTNDELIPLNEKDLFYATVKQEKSVRIAAALNNAGYLDSKVVIIPQNRLAKFIRDYPQAKEFIPYFRNLVKTNAEDTLSDEAKTLLAINYTTRRWVSRLDMTRVDDEWLRSQKALVDSEAELLKAYNANKTLATSLNMWYNVKDYSVDDEGLDIEERYPLLSHVPLWSKFPDDIYIYLNAAYAAMKEKKSE